MGVTLKSCAILHLMAIYLVQHGEAHSEAEDPERRLTQRGVEEARVIAAHLARAGVRVEAIYHSGKKRAEQTAAIFAEFLKPAGGVHPAEGLNPLDDPSHWASRLAEMDGVMLVGHLPHLGRLASLLVVGDPDKAVVRFRYSAVLCLAREGQSWHIAWYLVPELIPF